MPDSLRSRVGRLIAGSAHALLDKLEDQAPEAVMEQAVREVQAVIEEVRAELGGVAANRHLAQQQHAELNRRHLDLGAQVEHAIGQSRDDLARAAVARQLDIEAQLPILEATLADLAKEETELTGYIDALLGRQRDMNEAIATYRASREQVAATTSTTPQASSNRARLETASAAFDKVYARQTGMTPAAHGASLDQATRLKELDDLVRSNKIEERLARLKSGTGK